VIHGMHQLGQESSASVSATGTSSSSMLPWLKVVGVLASIGVVAGLAWYSTSADDDAIPNRKSGFRVVAYERGLGTSPAKSVEASSATEALKLANRELGTGRYEHVQIIRRATGMPYWEKWAPRT
jgi:hypothetical protein